jgi:hypothetical protein
MSQKRLYRIDRMLTPVAYERCFKGIGGTCFFTFFSVALVRPKVLLGWTKREDDSPSVSLVKLNLVADFAIWSAMMVNAAFPCWSRIRCKYLVVPTLIL